MSEPKWEDTIEIQAEDAPSWDDTQEIEKDSALESVGRGLLQGGTLGFADEAYGALAGLYDVATTDKELKDLKELYKKNRDEVRAANAKSKSDNPTAYNASEIGGAIATSFIPGVAAAKGASVANIAARGALEGAAYGLGNSEAESLKGLAKDTALGGAFGGAGGAAGAAIGKGVSKGATAVRNKLLRSKLLQKIGDKSDDAALYFGGKALGADKARINKIGADKVRDVTRYAIDEGIIAPPSLTANSTESLMSRNRKALSEAGESIGDIYKTIDDKALSSFDPTVVKTQTEEALGGFYNSPLNRSARNQYENTLEAIASRGEGNIPLKVAQELKEELGRAANWKNKLVVSEKEQLARDAYGIVNKALEEATDSGADSLGDASLKEVYKKAKKAYGYNKTIEELLDNKEAREQGNNFFGLGDLVTGAGGFAAMGPIGTAKAIAAKKVGERVFSPANNALVFDKLTKAIRSAPTKLGKYAPVLQNASRRGGKALASASFVLQQTDQDYRQKLEELENEESN